MAEEVEKKKDEDWMQKKWRPAMGWMYMLVCTLDMAVFPVLWSVLQMIQHTTITQWQPLTLQGAGLFHLAMGAVLGIAAFGRTQEKIAGTAANAPAASGIPLPAPAPAPAQDFGSINNTPSSTPSGFGAVSTGFGGKAAPPAAPQPAI
jgi:hypothetical protein